VATVSLGGVVLVLGLITLGALLVGFLGYTATSRIYSFTTGGSELSDLLRGLPLMRNFFSKPEDEGVEIEEIEEDTPEANLKANNESSPAYLVKSPPQVDDDLLLAEDDAESLIGDEDEDKGNPEDDEDEGNVDDDAVSSDLSSHGTMDDDNPDDDDDSAAQETQSDEGDHKIIQTLEPHQELELSPARQEIIAQAD
jgi:hypothetical protein